jgi:hypothetical protein
MVYIRIGSDAGYMHSARYLEDIFLTWAYGPEAALNSFERQDTSSFLQMQRIHGV